MILADTSVWIDHLRSGDERLAALLQEERVLVHPFVIGELACGTLARRIEVLSLLRSLPSSSVASHDEALAFLTARRLGERGIGWIDVHLLASAALSHAKLWTLDRNLGRTASSIDLAVK